MANGADGKDPTGVRPALAMLAAEGALDQGEAEQLALIDEPVEGFLPVPAAEARKAGRPRGVPNKATADWVRIFRLRFPTPLMGLGQVSSLPPGDLWTALGMTGTPTNAQLLKLFEIQQAARVALLPYLHQKQPIAVDVESRGHVTLTLTVGADMGPPGAQGETITVFEGVIADAMAGEDESEENQ